MTTSRPALFAGALVLAATAWPPETQAQDLFDRARAQAANSQKAGSAQVYRNPDRMDLRLGATFPTGTVVRDQGYGRLGFEGVFESDFACGKFDVKANLKSLVSKEARDEFLEALLGAVESELMYNALVLACETSPTACQAFQHSRVNANALLGIGYDRCAAIEAGIQDGLQAARAQSIKDCLNRKADQRIPLDEAQRACEKANDVSGLLGGRVAEFNLGQELVRAFKLEGVDARHAETLLSKLRYTPQGVKGEVQADAVLQEYAKIEKEIARAWLQATETAARNPNAQLDPEGEKAIAPTWTSGPLRIGLERIAALRPDVRRLRIELLSARAAAVEMTLRVQKLERYLAGAEILPQTSDERKKEIARERGLLRLQLGHMDEIVARKEAYNKDLLDALLHGEGTEHGQAAAQLGRGRSEDMDARMRREAAAPWGSKRGR